MQQIDNHGEYKFIPMSTYWIYTRQASVSVPSNSFTLFPASLGMQVVACFRHMASCVGGCTDTLQLRDELRRTREKAQTLAVLCCQRLTSRLRDKSLPEEDRREMELLWVAFSSGLELLHADLCKVFGMAQVFSLANTHAFVQTGIQGKNRR